MGRATFILLIFPSYSYRRSSNLAIRFHIVIAGRLHYNATMPDSQSILQITLESLQERSRSGLSSFAVFDLDSTLFDVTPRLQQILHDFANDSHHQKLFPENCKILKTAEAQHQDWGIRWALQRAGLDGHHPEFHQAIKEFWIRSFFSNSYLQYDRPYPGAIEYVNAVAATGAQVVYLTGRDIPRQGEGTEQALKKWGFPLHETLARMVLKPVAGLDDAEFKENFFRSLPSETATWLFENEPVNVNVIRRHHPHVKIVFVNTVHAGIEPPPEDIPHILHFVLEGN